MLNSVMYKDIDQSSGTMYKIMDKKGGRYGVEISTVKALVPGTKLCQRNSRMISINEKKLMLLRKHTVHLPGNFSRYEVRVKRIQVKEMVVKNAK